MTRNWPLRRCAVAEWNSHIHRDCYPTAVRRYVLTFKNAAGDRILFGAAQGRMTYASQEEAERYKAAVLANNSADTLARFPELQVRACACWPGHFDPCGVYFEEHPEDRGPEAEPGKIPGGPR